MHNPALQRLQIPIEAYHKAVQENLAPHRFELLEQQIDWIRRTESWIQEYFIHGSDVNVARIQPKLELVRTERQHAIWRYCRLKGSIPYNRGCGRLLRYLLRDEGQPNKPIMGVISLSSPVLINKPRDQWIGWQYPEHTDLKRRKLLCCMDLTVSMAIPPYNHLTAGKMICLSMLSDDVRKDYWDKFYAVETPSGLKEGRLALITTTSLYGSSVQYNRLKVGERLAYQLVGYTAGFGNAHVTEAEFLEMEQYLKDVGKPIPKGWGTGRSYRLRVYTAYHRHRFGQRHAPAHEQPRSVYVAPLAQNAQAFLCGEDQELNFYDLPFDLLVENWRSRWLTSRLRNPRVMELFRADDPTTSLLSRELEEYRLQTKTV